MYSFRLFQTLLWSAGCWFPRFKHLSCQREVASVKKICSVNTHNMVEAFFSYLFFVFQPVQANDQLMANTGQHEPCDKSTRHDWEVEMSSETHIAKWDRVIDMQWQHRGALVHMSWVTCIICKRHGAPYVGIRTMSYLQKVLFISARHNQTAFCTEIDSKGVQVKITGFLWN